MAQLKHFITTDLNDQTKFKIESRTHAPPQGFICIAPVNQATIQPYALDELNIWKKSPEGRILKQGEVCEGSYIHAVPCQQKIADKKAREDAMKVGAYYPSIESILPPANEFIYAYLEQLDGRPDEMAALLKKYVTEKRKVGK